MAENELPLKPRLRYFPLGIFDKSFTLPKWEERRRTKKEASKVVHEKNAIIRDSPELLKDIKQHEITKARRITMKIRLEMEIALQDTIDVIDNLDLLCKEDIGATIEFLKKQGEFLSREALEKFIGYMQKLKDAFETFFHYCNELEFVADGKEAQILGKIRSTYADYKKERSVWLWKRTEVWEKFHEKREVKRTFKEEGKILGIESKKFFKFSIEKKGREEEEFLRNYEKYVSDYVSLMTEMFIIKYIVLHNGLIAKNEIGSAMSERRYDLPLTYKVFVRSFEALLREEKGALVGIRRSVDKLSENVEIAIDLAKRSIKAEKRELAGVK